MHDEELLASFLDGRLQPERFNHHNHTRVTWMLMQRYPPARAEAIFCAALRQLAARLGAAEKYHHTLSIAFVRIIAARITAHPGSDWAAFRGCNPDLLEEGRALIARHYSDELLEWTTARQGFVEPDREALPCCASAS